MCCNPKISLYSFPVYWYIIFFITSMSFLDPVKVMEVRPFPVKPPFPPYSLCNEMINYQYQNDVGLQFLHPFFLSRNPPGKLFPCSSDFSFLFLYFAG